MTDVGCCFDLQNPCKNPVEFWVTKKNDQFFSNWWYSLCKEHLDKIIDANEMELEQLQIEAQRIRHRKFKLLDWEELGYHPKIHCYDKAFGDIKITMALKKHRKKKLKKYIERRKKYARFIVGITGLSEDMEEFILEQADHYEHHKAKFWTSFYKTCSDMWSNRVDLTDKQMAIIEREYNKVKDQRMKEWKENNKKR